MRVPILLAGVACALCAGAALPPETPTIRRDHPRLFFNADTWPAVKARAFGAAKGDLDRLLAACDKYPSNPKCSGTEPAPPGWSSATPLPSVKEWGGQAARCALAWRFTGKPEYLEKAKRMLTVSIAAYGESYRNRRAVCWESTSRILAICAYDWIFEALTPEERRAIIVPLAQHVEDIQPGKGHPAIVRRNGGGPTTGCYGVPSLLWYAGVAADGDGFCDELAASLLKRGYRVILDTLAFRDRIAGDDGALSGAVAGYSMGAYPWAHFNFFHTLASAAGVDAAAEYPNLALFPNWIWWNWIPSKAGPLHFGFGDTRHARNLLPIGSLYEHMTQYAFSYRKVSPDAARLAMSLRERAPKSALGSTWPMYPFIFVAVDDVKPFSAEELDGCPLKARHFESVGQFVMRSGWNDDATFCLFTSGGEVTQHRHFDENNFVIYRNGYQALDSGSRAKQTDHNLTYYYAQTVAHNCILIHRQPEEPITLHWGLKYDGPEGKCTYGGQGRAKATPIAFETQALYSYVASDATKSYGAKCKEMVRQFVHLQPDVFIVYDRVAAADAAYAKEWLLHTQNEPEISDGVVRSQAAGGALCLRTLLPEGAEVGKVGGPGKEYWSAGKNWELAKDYVSEAEKICGQSGWGPWFGQWRVEVKPKSPAVDDRFLHVINVGETGCRPVESEYQKGASTDGVRIRVPGAKVKGAEGTLEVSAVFNRTGSVGGEIHFRLIGDDGKMLFADSYRLAETVMPQSGVFSERK